MAFEAFQNTGLGVVNLIKDPHCLGQSMCHHRALARSGRERSERGVITEVVFDVPVLVYACYEGHGLLAGAKCPLDRDIHDIFVVGGAHPDGGSICSELELKIRPPNKLFVRSKRGSRAGARQPDRGTWNGRSPIAI